MPVRDGEAHGGDGLRPACTAGLMAQQFFVGRVRSAVGARRAGTSQERRGMERRRGRPLGYRGPAVRRSRDAREPQARCFGIACVRVRRFRPLVGQAGREYVRMGAVVDVDAVIGIRHRRIDRCGGRVVICGNIHNMCHRCIAIVLVREQILDLRDHDTQRGNERRCATVAGPEVRVGRDHVDSNVSPARGPPQGTAAWRCSEGASGTRCD